MKRTPSRFRYWLNLSLTAVFLLALLFFAVVIYASYHWAQFHSHPVRHIAAETLLTEKEISFSKVTLTTKDGVELSAWYTPPQNGSVILVAHGYNEHRPEAIYAFLAKHGYGVLAWDFRAHGESGGEVCTLGFYEQLDVEAALEYALGQPDVRHVGAWGGSMGAATMLLSAAKHPEVEAVVSDSAYPTLVDVISLNVPFKIMQPFVLVFAKLQTGIDLNQVRPVDAIAKISPRAVFVIDGWEGGAIAMNAPHRLFDAAADPKRLWVEDGVPHLGMYARDPLKYEEQVIDFFDSYLAQK
jgi:uncharacterized protein